MESNKENIKLPPEPLVRSSGMWEPFFTKSTEAEPSNTRAGGVWRFAVKTGIILIGIFFLMVMIGPDFSKLQSKLRQLDTAKARLVWLSFVQNPQALVKISELEEEEGKLDNAVRETELAIGLLEMHGADKQVIQRYANRINKLMAKKKIQEKEDFESAQQAAAKGYADAQYRLGVMYEKGFYVSKDVVKAVEWYRKSAAHGYAPGQNSLGVMYQNGKGTSRDMARAYAWFKLSAAQGHSDAIKNRDQIEVQLLPAQRAEGQRLASSWKRGDVL